MVMSRPRPPQWPPSIQFITTPRYHDSVPASTRAWLTGDASPVPPTRAVNPLVRIRPITNPAHPAHGQHGLFAHKKISSQTHIIDYIGEVHCQERAESDYDLSLYRSQDGTHVGIDTSNMGNEARFINDYRGICRRPNAEFVDYRTAGGELRVSVWSKGVTIGRGEEIVVSYGKSWWRSRT